MQSKLPYGVIYIIKEAAECDVLKVLSNKFSRRYFGIGIGREENESMLVHWLVGITLKANRRYIVKLRYM